MSNDMQKLLKLFAATSLISTSMVGQAYGSVNELKDTLKLPGGSCLVCEPHHNSHTNGHTDKHTDVGMVLDPDDSVGTGNVGGSPRTPDLISNFPEQ